MAAAHGPDDALVVFGRPDQTGLVVVELDLVRCDHPRRHAVVAVHEGRHGAARPLVRPSVALDLVADAEPQRHALLQHVLRRREAGVEPLDQRRLVEVLADEDQLAQARLVVAPRLAEVAVEGHVHRMVHEAPLGVLDGQYALHPEDVLARLLDELVDPVLQELEVELAHAHRAQVARRPLVETYTRHVGVVMGRRDVGVEQVRARLQRALQVEAVNVEHLID
mmetsp:Transcript_6321/g.14820  ORF Transcript_6321/g.14820 Transcript_6321/m.14820 type:complete len:223 (+) Transcript_6321:270-938(+)